MKIKDFKKLIEKYNNYFSERYGVEFDLFEDIKGSLDSIESLQAECISDFELTYKECELIKKYLYYKYIKEDIEDFKNIESECEE